MLLDAIPDVRDVAAAHAPRGGQGEVPNPLSPPTGCAFNPRCPLANERCRRERPMLRVQADGERQVACHAVEEGRVSETD
jgi:peptide/nickel transport system ATP-binding protein